MSTAVSLSGLFEPAPGPGIGSSFRSLPPATGSGVSALGTCTVLIEARTFFRQCVLASLQAAEPAVNFQAFSSIEAWSSSADSNRTALLILWLALPTSAVEPDAAFKEQLRQLQALPQPPMFAVMSDSENSACISFVMNHGARGYLPASMGLETSVKALDLIRAGGVYVPPSMLASAAAPVPDGAPAAAELMRLFTSRQIAVIKAMRRGLPNKIIAYELTMCESTVKVHVKNIMRKLKAKNRTEVAFLTRHIDDRTGIDAAA